MSLPSALLAALECEITVDHRALADAAAALSARYRGERSPWGGRSATSEAEAAAYAAYRLPATYAAAYAVLSEVAERLPGFSPRELLDVGAGPGTVMWAALSVWPAMETVTLVEREPEMIRLGRRLASYSPLPAVQRAAWIQQDATAGWHGGPADLVVASYVLGELAPQTLFPFVENLWNKARGVLALIEPGTPSGFERIAAARRRLLELGARIVAPCPHEGACPLGPSDWCHFSQRVQRTRLHRELKQGELPYEDEKYSYLAVSREAPAGIAGRVIRHPRVYKGHVRLELCTPGGIEHAVVSRKEGERYRWARKARWGSALPK